MALGIICILLIAGLGGAIAYYTMAINNKQSELNSANQIINLLNATIAKQNNAISQLNATIAKQNNAIIQLNTTVTNLQNQIASDNITVTSLEARVIIDGITYSTTPTSYDLLLIGYYTLPSEPESNPFGMGTNWNNQICWLLTPGEPTPPSQDLEVSNGSTPIMMMDPDPLGQIMINGWLYSQISTNLTEFTIPQFTNATFWTYMANEPIPTGAQILNSTG
jgi:uncharacterized coiled-coil protein SlyX